MEVGQTFMYLGNEYKIMSRDFINDKINIIPIGENKNYIPEIGEKIKIETIYFKVIYINKGKKRISLLPIL